MRRRQSYGQYGENCVRVSEKREEILYYRETHSVDRRPVFLDSPIHPAAAAAASSSSREKRQWSGEHGWQLKQSRSNPPLLG